MRAYLIAVLVLVLHAGTVFWLPEYGMAISYFFFFALGALAVVASARRTWNSGPVPDPRWLTLAASMLLWLCGMALSARQNYVMDNANPAPGDSMFFYILYVVPVLISLSSSPVVTRKRWGLAIDLVLASLLGVMFYVRTFGIVTTEGAAGHQEAIAIVQMLDLENVFMFLVAGVRLLAAERKREASFYRVVAIYFAVYCISGFFYNRFIALGDYPDFGSSWDILLDLQLLALLLAALHKPTGGRVGWRAPVLLVRIVQSGSPIFMSVSVLALGLLVMPHHSALGVAACAAAVLGIGIRSTLTQVSLVEVESRLQAQHATLEGLAYRDGLTELANRRALDETLLREWHLTAERGEPVALLMIDIDFFKQFNDRYGHLEGDECLRRVAGALGGRASREGDFLARYGGEEFAVIAPATTMAGAHQLAHALRESVAAMGIANEGSPYGVVTVSIGVAAGIESAEAGPLSLLNAADRALYKAKDGGRNTVVSST
jgi:diguanylate cyclase (GGDEF)-like protein